MLFYKGYITRLFASLALMLFTSLSFAGTIHSRKKEPSQQKIKPSSPEIALSPSTIDQINYVDPKKMQTGDPILEFIESSGRYQLEIITGFTPDGDIVTEFSIPKRDNLLQLNQEIKEPNRASPFKDLEFGTLLVRNIPYPHIARCRFVGFLNDGTPMITDGSEEKWKIHNEHKIGLATLVRYNPQIHMTQPSSKWYVPYGKRYGFQAGEQAIYKEKVQYIGGFHLDGTIQLGEFSFVPVSEISHVLKVHPNLDQPEKK